MERQGQIHSIEKRDKLAKYWQTMSLTNVLQKTSISSSLSIRWHRVCMRNVSASDFDDEARVM